jgi:hypothetical protein
MADANIAFGLIKDSRIPVGLEGVSGGVDFGASVGLDAVSTLSIVLIGFLVDICGGARDVVLSCDGVTNALTVIRLVRGNNF